MYPDYIKWYSRNGVANLTTKASVTHKQHLAVLRHSGGIPSHKSRRCAGSWSCTSWPDATAVTIFQATSHIMQQCKESQVPCTILWGSGRRSTLSMLEHGTINSAKQAPHTKLLCLGSIGFSLPSHQQSDLPSGVLQSLKISSAKHLPLTMLIRVKSSLSILWATHQGSFFSISQWFYTAISAQQTISICCYFQPITIKGQQLISFSLVAKRYCSFQFSYLHNKAAFSTIILFRLQASRDGK